MAHQDTGVTHNIITEATFIAFVIVTMRITGKEQWLGAIDLNDMVTVSHISAQRYSLEIILFIHMCILTHNIIAVYCRYIHMYVNHCYHVNMFEDKDSALMIGA